MRVLIVGEDPLARGGLALLLGGVPGLAVVGQVPPGVEGSFEAVHVVVWDLGAGSPAGLERLAGIAGGPGGAVLALAPDEETAGAALAAGAQGVLPREADARRLTAAVQAVAAGLVVVEEGFAALLLRSPEVPAPTNLPEPLTPRESEVLQLLAQGLSNPAIGERLGISEHTAKFHVNAILGKLGAQGRTDAVVRAARLGLILL
ncbi:MAG TPA: response regulator transcription factor [Thermoanaerobaculia bacterium]|nr:response regulator transcription factor [Thermoanaerobaculia bacterium]